MREISSMSSINRDWMSALRSMVSSAFTILSSATAPVRKRFDQPTMAFRRCPQLVAHGREKFVLGAVRARRLFERMGACGIGVFQQLEGVLAFLAHAHLRRRLERADEYTFDVPRRVAQCRVDIVVEMLFGRTAGAGRK